jgi:hypothetical protein
METVEASAEAKTSAEMRMIETPANGVKGKEFSGIFFLFRS